MEQQASTQNSFEEKLFMEAPPRSPSGGKAFLLAARKVTNCQF